MVNCLVYGELFGLWWIVWSMVNCMVYGKLYGLLWIVWFMVNCMVYGELGQFPLELQAKTRMLKLWFKLVNINCKHKFSNSMYTFLYDVYHAGIYKSTFLSNVENFKWDRPKRYVDKPVLLEYFQSKVQVWSYTNFKGPIYPKLAVTDYLKVNLLQLQNV